LGSTVTDRVLRLSSVDLSQSESEPPTAVFHLDAIAVFILSARLDPFPAQWYPFQL
jgi:hypothetical protein